MPAHSTRRILGAVVGATLAISLLTACSPPSPTPSTPATSAPVTATSSAPADPTRDWSTYHSGTDRLTLRYPPTWQLRTCGGTPHTSVFLGPTGDSVAVCNSDFSGQMSAVVFDGDQTSALHMSGSGVSSTPVTVAGVAGTREQGTAVASASGVGPVAGSILVTYVFFTGGLTYRLGYVQAPTGPTSTNVLPDFDLLVTRTLQFS